MLCLRRTLRNGTGQKNRRQLKGLEAEPKRRRRNVNVDTKEYEPPFLEKIFCTILRTAKGNYDAANARPDRFVGYEPGLEPTGKF